MTPERKPIGGVQEWEEGSPITKNNDYYEGHIPREEFPDYMHVLWTRCPYTDEPRTLVTWTSVKPVATVNVVGDNEPGTAS